MLAKLHFCSAKVVCSCTGLSAYCVVKGSKTEVTARYVIKKAQRYYYYCMRLPINFFSTGCVIMSTCLGTDNCFSPLVVQMVIYSKHVREHYPEGDFITFRFRRSCNSLTFILSTCALANSMETGVKHLPNKSLSFRWV